MSAECLSVTRGRWYLKKNYTKKKLPLKQHYLNLHKLILSIRIIGYIIREMYVHILEVVLEERRGRLHILA